MLPRSYDMEERDTTGDLYWEAPKGGSGAQTTRTNGNDGNAREWLPLDGPLPHVARDQGEVDDEFLELTIEIGG